MAEILEMAKLAGRDKPSYLGENINKKYRNEATVKTYNF